MADASKPVVAGRCSNCFGTGQKYAPPPIDQYQRCDRCHGTGIALVIDGKPAQPSRFRGYNFEAKGVLKPIEGLASFRLNITDGNMLDITATGTKEAILELQRRLSYLYSHEEPDEKAL